MKTGLVVKLAAWMSLVLLSFAVGYYATRDERPLKVPVKNGVRLYTSDGGEASMNLSRIERPIVAFVIAAECPFCADAAPRWLDLAERLRDSGRPFADIAVLSYSSVGPTEAFMDRHRLRGMRVFYLNMEAVQGLGTSSVPATMVVLPPGRQAFVWQGQLSKGDIDDIVDSLDPR